MKIENAKISLTSNGEKEQQTVMVINPMSPLKAKGIKEMTASTQRTKYGLNRAQNSTNHTIVTGTGSKSQQKKTTQAISNTQKMTGKAGTGKQELRSNRVVRLNKQNLNGAVSKRTKPQTTTTKTPVIA